jgi:hypothetical protein
MSKGKVATADAIRARIEGTWRTMPKEDMEAVYQGTEEVRTDVHLVGGLTSHVGRSGVLNS